MTTSDSQFLHIPADDGCRLAVRLDGPETAPPLLLLHALGTDFSLWDAFVPLLSRRFRLIRADLRGHGVSDAPEGDYSLDRLGQDMLTVLDHLGIGACAVAGISMGGMVGLWLAGTAPQRVNRLAALCTTAHYGEPAVWQERMESVRRDGLTAILPGVAGRWFTPAFIAARPDTVTGIVALVARQSALGYAGCCAALRDLDLRPLLPGITAETTIVGGLFDPATPPVMAEALAAAIPNARLTLLPTSHMAVIEAPNLLLPILLSAVTG
jgi:3-oxoadipate enol-lactonase